MNAGSPDSPTWTRRQWLYAVGLALVAQAGLIWLLGERPRLPTEPVVFATSINMIAEPFRVERLTLDDPAQFALPNLRSFSRGAWLTFAPGTYEMADWIEPPRWLKLDVEKLGESFSGFVSSNVTAPLLMADKAMPSLTVAEAYAKSDAAPGKSDLRFEGELARRPLLEPLLLPAWPNTDILMSTVVQLMVDGDGRTLSATLLESSGLTEADDFALKAATAARFQPVTRSSLPSSSSSQLFWGKMIFQWHSLAPSDFGGQAGQL